MKRGLTERVVTLGPRRSMVGIVTPAPAEAGAEAKRPAVVILNSGIVHRVGTHRLSVGLARALSSEVAMTALRFDLSGIGDSEPRTDGLSPLRAGMADVREALDTFAPDPSSRVVLVGLCAGADHALLSAGTDDRVKGIVLIDPTIPRTSGYYLRYYARRMMKWRSWLSVLRLRSPLVRKVLGRAPARPAVTSAQPDPDAPETRDALEQVYGRVVGRGVRILAIMTAGREHRHNYREQFLHAFPEVQWGSQLDLQFMDRCDHTFSTADQRTRLKALILRWLAAEFPK